MKKLALILVLAFVSSNAMATEWVKMPNEVNKVPTYLGEVTPGTHQFTLSMLINMDEGSSISELRGDCLTRELFIDSMTGFSEPMGKGNILTSATIHQLKKMGLHTKLNALVNTPGLYKIMLDMFCIK